MMKSHAPIDILRFLISFMVVAIHCGISDINDNIYNIFQSSVPLFFVISGYFIEKKRMKWGGYVDSYISKSWGLYLIWSAIYLPLTFYGCIINDGVWWKDIIFTLHGFLIKGENYYSWPLWYMLATIYAVYMYRYIITHKWCDKKIIIFTIILTSMGFALEYCSSIKVVRYLLFIIGGTRNGIFQGFSYLMVGVFIARYNIPNFIKRHSLVLWFIWLIILPISSYLPVPKSLFIDHFMCGLLISLLLASKVQFTFDTKPFRSIGVWIYFTHMYVVFFIKKLLAVSSFVDNIICVLPISICIAVILHYLSLRYNRIKTLICA